jgi:PAS domain-containing protein
MNARPKPVPAFPVSLRAVVGGIGLVVALLCSLVVPLGYAAFGYVERADVLSFKVRLNADRLARYVYAHETLWQYHGVRLAELIVLPREDQGTLRQWVFDGSGRVVLEDRSEISGPTLRRSAPIFVKGVMVGRIEAEASLTALYVEVGWLMLFSTALGFAAYVAFRVVPLRVLDRTLGKLKRREHELQAQNLRFDTALNNMSQGLSMFDAEQRLVVCNESAMRTSMGFRPS